MIDYFLKFNSEADAITAALQFGKLGYYDNASPPVWHWDTSYVVPDLKTWRISQDAANPNGGVIHTYLPGWFALVSTANPNSTLSNHAALAIELNRDGDSVNGPPYLRKNKTGIPATDLNFQPVFAGSHYPIGGLSP